jgi:hypothetical protein
VSEPLRQAFAALRKARLVGYAGACILVTAVILFADGLQMLMRTDFNEVHVVAGERVAMSGSMPLKVKEHADIVVFIEGHDELIFTPHEHFKGLWFGTHMWRATLDASAATKPGTAFLTIEDLVPAKSKTTGETIEVQNPAQTFVITVWASKEAMQAAHLSYTRRVTGISPFIKAAVCLACGIALGVMTMFSNLAAHSALAQLGLFAVHGRLTTEQGYLAVFSPDARRDLRAGQPMILLTPDGIEQGKGVLSECTQHKGLALFPFDCPPPLYGWLLRYEPEPDAPLEPKTHDTAS